MFQGHLSTEIEIKGKIIENYDANDTKKQYNNIRKQNN